MDQKISNRNLSKLLEAGVKAFRGSKLPLEEKENKEQRKERRSRILILSQKASVGAPLF